MNVSRRMLKERRIDPSVYGLESIKLDIGCGDVQKKKSEGYIGVDIFDFGQEVVWDIEDGIPFADNSVDAIFTEHTLEHIEDFIGVMNEFHRMLKPECELYVVVPHVTHPRIYTPTHCTFLNEESFMFFDSVDEIERYGVKRWSVGNMILNDRHDLHVTNMKPLDK